MKLSNVVFLSILVVCLAGAACNISGLSRAEPGGPSGAPTTIPDDAVAVFLTGNILSTLQPCGCSAGQLGGFDRRGAVFAAAPAQRRVVVDTGNLLASNGPQDMIKLGIMWQAMAMLGYDAVNLTAADIAAAANAGLAEGGPFSLISPAGEPDIKNAFSRKIEAGGRVVKVTVASAHAASLTANRIQSLFGRREGLALNILIIDDASEQVLARLEKADTLDVVFCPTAADEPRMVRKNSRRPLFVTVGRLGKYVARVTARPTAGGKLAVAFEKIAVDEDLPQDEDLVHLYKDYQFMVQEEQLLEKHLRVPLPDGLRYLGNENCRSCHDYEYEMWSKNPHAHAYETLVKVGSQYDPECVRCHVVGFGYESGFVSEHSAKDLRGVGCEVCHGPGSAHMKALTTGRGGTGISEPMANCIDCHNLDRSPGYQGHEAEYLRKIIHWREPEALGDVK